MVDNSPIIVGGCGRSGTTLLRLMLDSHPRICCGPELKLLVAMAEQARQSVLQWSVYLARNAGMSEQDLWRSYGAAAQALLETYRIGKHKPRVAEKTPVNVLCFESLQKMLPEARFIQIIRDGRDVVASLLRQNWVDAGTGQLPAYTQHADAAAAYWVQSVRAGRKLMGRIPVCYFEVFYEKLVRDPRLVTRQLCDFLDEDWTVEMVLQHEQVHTFGEDERAFHGVSLQRPPNDSAVGRWRRDLTDSQVGEVMRVAGPLLQELGYWYGEA